MHVLVRLDVRIPLLPHPEHNSFFLRVTKLFFKKILARLYCIYNGFYRQ